MREHFLLEDGVVFLNHGSFGACPRVVFDEYQRIQRQIELQPVRFFVTDVFPMLTASRAAVAELVGTSIENLVPALNATYGVNVIANSIPLKPGDEILSNTHEYGACIRAWDKVCRRTGAVMVHAEIPLPISSSDEIFDRIVAGATERTKVLFVSHLTSPSGLVFPIERLVGWARERGIITFVDGAHAPAHVTLRLDELGVDFYTGNCHKWLCAPKGSGFIFARPEWQHVVEPLTVSWGPMLPSVTGSSYIDELIWPGTYDPSPFLTIPAAIRFQHEHNWASVSAKCRAMALEVKGLMESIDGAAAIAPSDPSVIAQMAAVSLPTDDNAGLKSFLLDKYNIEIPIGRWHDMTIMRASIQAYNTMDEYQLLVRATNEFLKR
ncbi:MAG TPA: aminotransferase class V-fold PLP-dependent enzyme [Fimbriimonas sp.]|nr:aminotransferase class V-fold PLP-dependent enzyme [Fimbriimonas sp.]